MKLKLMRPRPIQESEKARTQESEKATKDLREFRKYLHRGKPGPHSYVILLGLRIFDTRKLLKSVEEGLSFSAFERFQRNIDLPVAALTQFVQIPLRTLTRRKEQGRLQPDESDRLLRASRIFGKALELFEGDSGAARLWLSDSQPALGGAIPLNIAKSELGAREVEKLIGRLEHGIFS